MFLFIEVKHVQQAGQYIIDLIHFWPLVRTQYIFYQERMYPEMNTDLFHVSFPDAANVYPADFIRIAVLKCFFYRLHINDVYT
jgi:hypothetical protein